MRSTGGACQVAGLALAGLVASPAAAGDLRGEALLDHVRALSAAGSRVTGYAGADVAAGAIAGVLERSGVGERYRRAFEVPVPIDDGAEIRLDDGAAIRLHCVWPNLSRTPTTGSGGLSGPLVDAGRGGLDDLAGLDLRGAIALVDYDCGGDWVRAFDLGAHAVVFLAGAAESAPRWARRSEGAAKFLSVPADLPRYYAPHPAAQRLRAAARGQRATIRARMAWRRSPAATIVAVVPGTDPRLAAQGLVIAAYYDAVSPVPALAPGADQAGGIAAWLELAATLARNPARRTAVLVAAPGHFQDLAGMRDFVGLLRRVEAGGAPQTDLERRLAGLRVGTALCLDLSSHGAAVALVQAGTPYRVRTVRPELFASVEAHAAAYEERVLGGRPILGGALKPLALRRTLGLLPEPIPLDGAVFSLAGFLGLTLVSAGDGRALFDSPEDRASWIDGAGLTRQAAYVLDLARHLLDADGVDLAPPRGRDSYGVLRGRFVLWGQGQFEPDEPVADAFVRVRCLHPVLAGVRPDPVALTGQDGRFELAGVEARTLYLKPVELEAYGAEAATGAVTIALDRGPFGAMSYPARVLMDHNEEERTLVGFAARSVTLTDLLDPRRLTVLDRLRLLDGVADADLERYGDCLPYTEGEIAEKGYDDSAGPRQETVGVLFVPRDRPLKVTMTSGRLGLGQRLVLLGASAEHPFGEGLTARDGAVLWGTAGRTAVDLVHLNGRRLADLETHGIRSRPLRALHERSRDLAGAAQAARAGARPAEALAAARQAWSLAARVHEAIAALGADAVMGLLVVLLALLPFSMFAERLLLEGATIRAQVAGTVAAFVLAFAILRAAHPAFELTVYPLVVLIGFAILALSAAVTAIGLGRLNAQLRQSVSPDLARHRVDPRRAAMAGRAFLLGVAQMRRRPLRTGLTCATLALLTFALVSFTSVRSTERFHMTPAPRPAAAGADAVALRRPGWEGFPFQIVDELALQLGAEPAPRLWYSQPALLRRGERSTQVAAALGLSPAERRIGPVADAVRAGGWLSGAPDECLLSLEGAAQLGIAAPDVGAATVTFLGEAYRVVGLVDGDAMDAIVDVAGAPLTPLDLDAYQPEERRAGVDRRGEAPAFTHLPARQIVILPARIAAGLGPHARLASVAAPLPGGRAQLERLAHGLSLNLFARVDGASWIVDTATDHTLSGERGVWVPVAIAALIVLNTMLGSVSERIPQIATLNAVGLAPGHVTGLFLAEAAAFATLGGVGGYLAAQVASRIDLASGLFPGLTVNVSSDSAVATLALTMAVVVLSAWYPARAAGRLCVPGIERAWRLPRPQGDRLRLPMPFSLRRWEAVGLARFVAEYVGACDEQSLGASFYAEDVVEADGSVAARLWLAPFDAGVSQQLRIDPVPEDAGYARLVLDLRRQSGEEGVWLRANRRFVEGLRRQFLMWRALTPQEREPYQTGLP